MRKRLVQLAAETPLAHLLTVLVGGPLAAFVAAEVTKLTGIHLGEAGIAAVFLGALGAAEGVFVHYIHFRLPAPVQGIVDEVITLVTPIIEKQVHAELRRTQEAHPAGAVSPVDPANVTAGQAKQPPAAG